MRARVPGSLLAWLLAIIAASSAHSFERVIAVGDAAPGFESGAVIAGFPAAPRINGAGGISFVATVARADGARVQTIYRSVDGAIERIAVAGDPAPGGGDLRFGGFPFFPSSPFLSNGRATFAAEGVDPSGFGLTGVWTDRLGFLERLLLQGESLPGMPPGEEVTDFALDARVGVPLLRARFTRNLTQIFNEDNGLWRNANGTWSPIAVKGAAAPGISGAVFDGDTPGFGTVSFFTSRADGRVLLQAWVEGRGVSDDDDEGLWVETPLGLQLLVREGARAPLPGSATRPKGKGGKGSATFGPTAAFSPTFGGDNENATASINDAGQVAFGAALRTPSGRSGSIWTNRAGTLELIALGSLGLVGSGPSTQAPGMPAENLFATFQLTRISPSGRIAFLAATRQESPVFLTPGVWWDVPGPLSLVAAGGTAVGSIPNAFYVAILQLDRFGPSGELAFEASLTGAGIDATNNLAVFRASPSGSAQPVLRTGDSVLTPEGTRTIRAYTWGEGRSAKGAGIATITFTDRTSGVYLFALQ
jgi:hypothetical protein